MTIYPSTMTTFNPLIPRNEREALQWLIPALDRTLADMEQDAFLKAWSAIGYLYGGLDPDATIDHGTEMILEDDGPDRFRLIETRLIVPRYERSGWPVVLAPIAEEAWFRYEQGLMKEDEFYYSESLQAGIRDRMSGETGLASTTLKS